MSKPVHEKITIVATSDEAAAAIAKDREIADGDWVRVESADVAEALIAECKGVSDAVREMAFDNDSLGDQNCRAVISALSAASWKNHRGEYRGNLFRAG